MRARKGDCMKLIEIFQKVDSKFKADGYEGIDKIIETEKAWIATLKKRDNEVVYGEYPVIVFKNKQDKAFLLTPELRMKAGEHIKETPWSDFEKAS